MAKTRLVPNHQLTPALRGALVRYYSRGQWLVQSWPKKRGTPKSLKVQNQNNWFRDMVQLMKYAPERQQIIARQMAEGTGKYPHDIMMMAAAGNVYEIVLPDGSILEKYQPEVKPAVFTGCRLLRTSSLALPASTSLPIPWQSAALDTAGFWDIGDPTKITIPTGVNVVELFGGVEASDGAASFQTLRIWMSGPGYIGRFDTANQNNFRQQVFTGPIAVAPGITFRLEPYCTQARTIMANQQTFLSLNVLDAS
jgi:hypothetical protein